MGGQVVGSAQPRRAVGSYTLLVLATGAVIGTIVAAASSPFSSL